MLDGSPDMQWVEIQHPDSLPATLAYPDPLKQGPCFGAPDLI